MPENDAVNSPSHYQGFSNGAEVIDIIEHLIGNRYSAVKYITRAGRKEGADELEDLRKAQWHINREVARIEDQRKIDMPQFRNEDDDMRPRRNPKAGDMRISYGRTARWNGDMWIEILDNRLQAVQYSAGKHYIIAVWAGDSIAALDQHGGVAPVHTGDWLIKNEGKISVHSNASFMAQYPAYVRGLAN